MAKIILIAILVSGIIIEIVKGQHSILSIDELQNENLIPSKDMRRTKRDTSNQNFGEVEGSGNDMTYDLSVIPFRIDPRYTSEDIPLNNPPILKSVTTKDFSEKNLTELSNDIFEEENVDNLNILILDNNIIETIDKEVFRKILNLKHLSMKNNKLTHLETETFSDVTKLTELNLDGNPLVLPEITHFLTISSLRNLTMSECGLKSIPENTFDGMTGLEELDIGKNPIDGSVPITKGLFEPLSNLSKLVLPLGSSEDLIKEVCKAHALLQKICVDVCDSSKDHSCVIHDEQSPSITEAATPLMKSPVEEEAFTGVRKVVKVVEKISDEVSSIAKETAIEVKETVAKAALDELKIIKKLPGIVEETPLEEPEIPDKLPGIGRKMPGMEETPKSPQITDKLPDVRKKMPEIEGATSDTMVPVQTKSIINTKLEDEKTNQTGGVPASSQSGVTSQGVNGPAIGIIVGIIILVIVGIVAKKNWSKIKSKWDSNGRTNPNAVPVARKNADIPRSKQPEEVPLKSNTDQDNPV